MKTGIHPESKDVKVICSCGESFPVQSTTTEKDLRVEVCAKCHPYYTGEQKLMKTGAMDKFYARKKKMEELSKKK